MSILHASGQPAITIHLPMYIPEPPLKEMTFEERSLLDPKNRDHKKYPVPYCPCCCDVIDSQLCHGRFIPTEVPREVIPSELVLDTSFRTTSKYDVFHAWESAWEYGLFSPRKTNELFKLQFHRLIVFVLSVLFASPFYYVVDGAWSFAMECKNFPMSMVYALEKYLDEGFIPTKFFKKYTREELIYFCNNFFKVTPIHDYPYRTIVQKYSITTKNLFFLYLLFGTITAFPINSDVCSSSPHPIFPTCDFFDTIPGFSFNLFVDEDTNSFFTTCKYKQTSQEITLTSSLTCYDLNFTATVAPGCAMTGDINTCQSTSNCTSSPECYCTFYSISEIFNCYHSLLTNTYSPYHLDSIINGGMIYSALQVFSIFEPVNDYNIHYKLDHNTIYLVLPYEGLFHFVISTPMETISTSIQSDIFKFTFPDSYSGRSYPFYLKMYDSENNLVFEQSDKVENNSFCKDPTCYFCKRAFDNFSCLDGLHKTVLVFGIIVTLILTLGLCLFILFVSIKLISKLKFWVIKVLPSRCSKFPTTMKNSPDQNLVSYSQTSSSGPPKPNMAVQLINNIKSRLTLDDVSGYVREFKLTSEYDPNKSAEYNNVFFKDFIKNRKILLRNPKSDYTIYFMLICVLSLQVYAQCNQGESVSGTVTLCSQSGPNSQICTLEFTTTVSLDRLMYVTCFTIKDQSGEVIGSMRLGYLAARYKIYYNLEYYTSGWYGVSQSNFRCYNSIGGYCTTDYCNSPNRTAFGNLDDPYLQTTYGITNCDRVGVGSSNCFFSQNGCLYSGWGAVPETETINAVYSQSTTTDTEVDIFYEILLYETRTYGNFTGVVGQVVEINDIGIDGVLAIDINSVPFPDPNERISRISYPSGDLTDVINPPGIYQAEKIGDIQSVSPTSFTYPREFQGIVTSPNAIVASKVIHSHNADYTFHTNGLEHNINSPKLPIELNHQRYSIISGGSPTEIDYVLAEYTNPPGIEFTIYTQFQIEKLVESCTFDITITSVSGCCDCSTNAILNYNIEYISDSFCNILFTSSDVGIITPFNSEIDGIIFQTDTCQQDINIRAQSGSFSQNLKISISLEHPILQTFSDGLTTIEAITSIEYSSDGDLKDVIPSFFKKFNTHNIIHWAMLFLIIIIGILFSLLLIYCVIQFLMIIISRIIKNNKMV